MIDAEKKKEYKYLLLLATERLKKLKSGFDTFTESELRIAAGDTVTPLQIIEEGLD